MTAKTGKYNFFYLVQLKINPLFVIKLLTYTSYAETRSSIPFITSFHEDVAITDADTNSPANSQMQVIINIRKKCTMPYIMQCCLDFFSLRFPEYIDFLFEPIIGLVK